MGRRIASDGLGRVSEDAAERWLRRAELYLAPMDPETTHPYQLAKQVVRNEFDRLCRQLEREDASPVVIMAEARSFLEGRVSECLLATIDREPAWRREEI